MEEVFKDIKGYEGLYQISNFGNVKSLNYKNAGVQKLLTPKKTNSGYLGVELYKNGKRKYFLIHRLVATSFLENKYNHPIINHIDENKENNICVNLEWCSYSYNVKYSIGKHKKQSNSKIKRKSKYKNVLMMDLDGNVLDKFDSISEIKEKFDYNYWSIRQCCFGKRKQAYGYKWEFA